MTEFEQSIRAAGLKKVQLARLCGVAPQTVSRWCKSADEPKHIDPPEYARTIVRWWPLVPDGDRLPE